MATIPTGPIHCRPVEEIVGSLETDASRGLSAEMAAARRQLHGPNTIFEGRRRGRLRILIDQFTDFMIVVLLAAAVISGLIGDATDAAVIIGIVILNATIGFIQEGRAESAIAGLRKLAAPRGRVVRDGATCLVPASELVPGDVVLIDAGALVPADLRLLESAGLRTQEAALTGESVAIDKRESATVEPDAPIGDRLNMLYQGTMVVKGRARGVVVATGMSTELGRIAGLLQATGQARTPLQRRLERFGRVLALGVLALCALIFVTGVLRGEPVLLMLMTALSLAVAAIPEALPAMVTVALALGARRMVRHQALVRKLPAVETLGSVTCICTDKTGTLTQNRMHVEVIAIAGGDPGPPTTAGSPDSARTELFLAMALNNDVRLDAGGKHVGDPTEVALLEVARAAGIEVAELAARLPRIAELPFDPVRRSMTTVHRQSNGPEAWVAYVKGSPEETLAMCATLYTANGPATLDRRAVLARAHSMAAQGLRVLAYARRGFAVEPKLEPGDIGSELEFLGLVGLLDPPREEAAAAIADCIGAGVRPVMITGDHPETARAVAERVGLSCGPDELMTGASLDRLSDAEFERLVRDVRVYARAAPEHKIRIVRALQAQGELVAMTGDGVNDAPALRCADIGVAMGLAGTDVAKEAAHMVLLDDNFATIVRAIRAGRRTFDNIRKFIKYTMTSNSGEIWTIFLAPLLGLPIPLLPIHILWINLVTDGLPGLALSAEKEERDVMRRPPRPTRESVFAHGMWQHILWVGLLMGAASLFTQAWAIHAGIDHWQTMVFTVLTLSQLGHVLAVRADRESLFVQGILSNRPLLATLFATFLLQMATIYVPALNPIFRTAPLSASELVFCLVLSSVVFVAVEGEKWMIRHGRLYATGMQTGES